MSILKRVRYRTQQMTGGIKQWIGEAVHSKPTANRGRARKVSGKAKATGSRTWGKTKRAVRKARKRAS